MRTTDQDEFASFLTDALGFYGQSVTPFSVSVWWQACQNFSMEQVRKAFTAHAMNPDRGQWAPKPADLVRELAGTHQDRSLVAWGRVVDAMSRVGAYSSPDFQDRATHCAIEDMGGWPAMCRTEVDQLGYMQKRFCDAHKAYTSRPEIARDVQRLTGIHETTNRALGRAPAEAMTLQSALVRQIRRTA